jgi:DNA-binding response OmpR family regulator
MARLLIVDRDANQVAVLKTNLEREGHAIDSAVDGQLAIAAVREREPDLIIVDPDVPDMRGFELCRALRQETIAPILILTAKEEEVDKIVALELGADDYITKPFSMNELLARVGARLRRAKRPAASPPRPLAAGDLRVDLVRREVRKGGRVVDLRLKEFELLAFLMEHPGRTVTRGELLRQIWGYEAYGGSRTVDVHVNRLREKIEDEPERPTRIVTVRGVGYRFEI